MGVELPGRRNDLIEEGGIVVGSEETGKEVQRLEIIAEVEYFHERVR